MSGRMVLTSEPSGVCVLKMNDRSGRNIFSAEFISEFLDALEEMQRASRPKVLILCGLQDVFCGGAEKKALLDLCDGKAAVRDLVICERLLEAPFPVIAAMEGHAVGGGLMLAVCCDMVVAARESRYGASFMELGFTPGMGCTRLLEELVGPYVASEMMYTARLFKGSELAEKGTNFNAIVPRTEVMKIAIDMARRISEKDREPLRLLKYALASRRRKTLVEAQVDEDLMHRITFALPQTRANIEAMYKELK